ncbi:MAG TPA: hypothetical protein VF364_11555 [Candidatus Limnocylindria bacterium]
MSIRLDPRRVNALKHLAGEAGVRPGDLVRRWVEERIDAERSGAEVTTGGQSLLARVEALAERVAALESAGAVAPADPQPSSPMTDEAPRVTDEAAPVTDGAPPAQAKRPGRPRKVSAAPSGERVALHDEMIAVLQEQGPLPAAELSAAIVERGRYTVPRSGKPLDAKTVSQRVSNPTYRARFVRREGRIGLADGA